MQKIKKIQTIVLIIFLLAVGLVAGYFRYQLKEEKNLQKPLAEISAVSEISAENEALFGQQQTYTHPEYGFTFNYPEGFTLGLFSEGEGEIILVQNQGSNKDGFQIFIAPYEEEEPLSFELIKEQAAELNPDNEKTIGLDKESIAAFVFDSSSAELGAGAMREIWFEYEGVLYQATSFPEFGSKMEEIIKTIRFN